MQIKNKKGISLIETLIYLAIAIFVLAALFAYGWNIMGLSAKARSMRETLHAAQLIREKLVLEIRRAQSIDRDNSRFGSSPAKLTLVIDGENVIFEEQNGRLTIKRGGAGAVALHSADVQIENMEFFEQVSLENETEYVGFSLDVAADYPGSTGRSEYFYDFSVASGAALRK